VIFSVTERDNTHCDCIGCGRSEFEGMGTIIKRTDGQYEVIQVCAACLFKAAVGEQAWNKALGKKAPPSPIPEPAAIKPRWFG